MLKHQSEDVPSQIKDSQEAEKEEEEEDTKTFEQEGEKIPFFHEIELKQ